MHAYASSEGEEVSAGRAGGWQTVVGSVVRPPELECAGPVGCARCIGGAGKEDQVVGGVAGPTLHPLGIDASKLGRPVIAELFEVAVNDVDDVNIGVR